MARDVSLHSFSPMYQARSWSQISGVNAPLMWRRLRMPAMRNCSPQCQSWGQNHNFLSRATANSPLEVSTNFLVNGGNKTSYFTKLLWDLWTKSHRKPWVDGRCQYHLFISDPEILRMKNRTIRLKAHQFLNFKFCSYLQISLLVGA